MKRDQTVGPATSIGELKQQVETGLFPLTDLLETVLVEMFKRPEIVVFGSTTTVAKACGVSQSTVMRLPGSLNLSSFEELRRLFRTHIRSARMKTITLQPRKFCEQ